MRGLRFALLSAIMVSIGCLTFTVPSAADDCLCEQPPISLAPSPVVVYGYPVVVTPPPVVYTQPVYVPQSIYYYPMSVPAGVYHPVPAPPPYKMKFEARRRGYEYEYKVYSPRHRRIYKYEAEVRPWHVEIEEEFH